MQDPSPSPQPATRHAVTLIEGDGVGPEIMDAVRRVLDAAGVAIDWEPAEAGARVFQAGVASGVPRDTLDSLARNKVALKGPLETPVGHGGKSANVTLRKVFETFGNVRPVRELPGVQTPFSGRGVDLVVVRENVEDLYAGIEHTQTPDVAQCLKLISTKGCEKVSRLAFEVARAENRGVVHVATKANIMKKTEGMMKREFEAAAADYPDLEARHILVDNCAHQLVIRPEQFDVILTTNMNGDILSDLTSGLVGGLGLAPSANIGHDCAIFEAVHGSAPDIAGQDKVNPTAILLSAVMLLRHLGAFSAADSIETALFKTLAEGQALTADIAGGRPVAGTRAFTEAVIANLGQPTGHHEPRAYRPLVIPARSERVKRDTPKSVEVVGIDVFTEMDAPPATVGQLLDHAAAGTPYRLKMVSNRGTMVYPDRGSGTDCVDHWRCRFILENGPVPEPRLTGIEALLRRIEATGMRWMHIEKLHRYDGEDAFTKAQGED